MELRATSLPLNAAPTGNSPEAVADAARQLESQFAKMMIGMMRQTALGDSMFPGAASQFRDLYDRELANVLTKGEGLGLQPMIRAQLSGQNPADATKNAPTGLSLDAYRARRPALEALRPALQQALPVSAVQPAKGHPKAVGELAANEPSPVSQRTPSLDRAPETAYSPSIPGTPEAFIEEMWPHAQRAAAELGVSPKALLAQAALETGWGRRGLRHDDGRPAHNLFGIKASGGWQQAALTRPTREVINGREVVENAAFRAYNDPAQSFDDYVSLLKGSQRYAGALGKQDARGFAEALQRAGYATDPQYAAKISAIAEGPTMRRALAALDGAIPTSTRSA